MIHIAKFKNLANIIGRTICSFVAGFARPFLMNHLDKGLHTLREHSVEFGPQGSVVNLPCASIAS
jgi:hypothetical protein